MLFDFDKYLGQPAIIDDTEMVVTFDDLAQFKREIVEIVPERSLVFHLSRNVCGSMAGYCVFVSTTIVPAMFDAGTNKDMMDNLINIYQPDYFWLPEDMVETYPGEVVYTKFNYCMVKTGLKSYPMHPELGLLLTTSGSTGTPKLVRTSYSNIDGFETLIANYCCHDESIPNHHISTMPIYHNYDLLGLSRMLYYGWYCLLTTKSIISPDFWKFFKKYGANSFGSVPFNYELLEKVKFREMGLKMSYTTEAGGSMPVELQKAYAQWHHDNGGNLQIIYGATEAPGGLIIMTGLDNIRKLGSIGQVVPPGRAEIWDDDGSVITEPNIPGEIVYFGPTVCMGYASCGEDLIKGYDYTEGLHTGDIAYRDEEDFYYIVGRKARFLKFAGERVSMDETEKLISQELGGIPVACHGVDNNMGVYVCSDDESLKDKIIMYLISKLKISPTMVNVKFMDEFPRLANGKINYQQLG